MCVDYNVGKKQFGCKQLAPRLFAELDFTKDGMSGVLVLAAISSVAVFVKRAVIVYRLSANINSVKRKLTGAIQQRGIQ